MNVDSSIWKTRHSVLKKTLQIIIMNGGSNIFQAYIVINKDGTTKLKDMNYTY